MKMKNKILIPMIIGLVLASGLIGCRYFQEKNNKSEVPDEFQEQYNWLSQFLDEKIKEWKPKEYKKMNFCGLHMPVNGELIAKTPQEIDIPFLEMLQETGADCIRITIMLPLYEKYKERYDTLVKEVKAKNLKLMISYNTVEKYSNFEEYKERELEITKSLVNRYQPDYYLILNEPKTMEKRTGLEISDEQWIELVKTISRTVKEINPSTKTIATVDKSELYLSKKFALIHDLNVVGFNIYGWPGIYKGKGRPGGDVAPLGDVVGEAIDFAKAQGKETFITETWLTSQKLNIKLTKAPSDFNEPWREPLDAKWIKLIVYYAQKHKTEGVLPFFTSKFITYPGEVDFKIQLQQVIHALKNKERTEVFYAYKEVIEEVKGK